MALKEKIQNLTKSTSDNVLAEEKTISLTI